MNSIKDWSPAAALQWSRRVGRKPKPVVYLDLETRTVMAMDSDGQNMVAVAYKVGEGPYHLLPWEAACARGDWAAADRLHAECFAEIRRQHLLDHYEDFAFLDHSWLTRKFLTLVARTRKLLGR